MNVVRKTRQTSGSRYGGAPGDLPAGHLPSYGEMAAYYYKLRDENGHKTTDNLIDMLEADLRVKWCTVSDKLPLIEPKSLYTKLKRLIDRVSDFDRKRMSKNAKENFLKLKDLLFDVAACQCELPLLECSDR